MRTGHVPLTQPGDARRGTTRDTEARRQPTADGRTYHVVQSTQVSARLGPASTQARSTNKNSDREIVHVRIALATMEAATMVRCMPIQIRWRRPF